MGRGVGTFSSPTSFHQSGHSVPKLPTAASLRCPPRLPFPATLHPADPRLRPCLCLFLTPFLPPPATQDASAQPQQEGQPHLLPGPWGRAGRFTGCPAWGRGAGSSAQLPVAPTQRTLNPVGEHQALPILLPRPQSPGPRALYCPPHFLWRGGDRLAPPCEGRHTSAQQLQPGTSLQPTPAAQGQGGLCLQCS